MTDNAEVSPATSPNSSETSPVNKDEYRTFHQNELNDLLKEQRERGYKKGQQDGISQAGLSNNQQHQPAPQSTQGGMGGMAASPDPEEIKRLVTQQLEEHSRNYAAQQIVSDFATKMNQGRAKYPDFDQKIAMLGDLKNIPDIVQLAASVDNTHDVMYDLVHNPEKIAMLRSIGQTTPMLAYDKVKKLSESIKANEDASQQDNPSAPLDQFRSSVSTDGGTKNTSIDYFKTKYRG